MTETPNPAGRRQAAFGFIFASALLNAVSFGIMIPILPNLIKQLTGGDTALASEWNVVFSAAWGLVQFFCSPVLGLMSDRFGRRPVMLVSLFGLALDFLFMAFAPTLMWLLVGRLISGATSASFSTANAYLADITPPERRAKAFGLMGSAFSFGFLIGPALGGWLGELDLRLPFLVAAALTFANVLYGVFVLPESLPPERRAAQFDWAKANPVGAFAFLRRHGELLGLAGVGFLFQLAHTVLPSIFVLYTGYRYGWTPVVMGLTMAVTGVLGIIVQSLMVGPVVQRIGERGALLVGCFAGAVGFVGYGFAPNGVVYLAVMPVFALMSLAQPGLQGLMTRRVAPNEQGQLQGANQGLTGVAGMVGPILFGLTFAWSVRHDAVLHTPGLAIYFAGALMVLAWMLAVRVGRAPAGEAAAKA